jgi:outer membrane protein OmpA-like peptidoglycan-associated protein
MKGRRPLPAVLAATALLLSLGCATSLPGVRARWDSLREQIHRAKALGGLVCAPADLARAQTAYRFATMEFEAGDLARADEHLQDGLASVERAVQAGLDCGVRGPIPREDRLARDPWPDADGDGVDEPNDKCPYVMEDRDGHDDGDGCPDPDNDGDGIDDARDRCPDEPEDLDGWEDGDGCPDPDNDGDGLADASDLCPDEAETKNGYQDDDGCADFRAVLLDVQPDRLEPRQPLAFVENSPLLAASNQGILKEIAELMRINPTWRLRIEGHMDSKGDPAWLKDLSVGRARAVREALVGLGVAAERLGAEGFGGDRPKTTNRTEEGRRQNRRVEILVQQGP